MWPATPVRTTTATATVRLTHGPEGLDIEVCDDGQSQAVNGASSGTGSGIAGMR